MQKLTEQEQLHFAKLIELIDRIGLVKRDDLMMDDLLLLFNYLIEHDWDVDAMMDTLLNSPADWDAVLELDQHRSNLHRFLRAHGNKPEAEHVTGIVEKMNIAPEPISKRRANAPEPNGP